MSNTTISTFGQSNYITSQILRVEAKYATVSTEESSGLKSQYFNGIASDAYQVLNLQNQQSSITSQTSNATTANTKLNVITGVLNNASDIITSALSTLSSAITNSTTPSTTPIEQSQLQSALDEMVTVLNTTYAGGYLFGGSNTTTPPVNINDPGYTGLTGATPNTSYYQGNDYIESVQVEDSLNVGFGVTADNPAFEQALRGLSMAAANPSDLPTLQAAFNLVQNASTGIGNLAATATAKSSLISSQINVNQTTLNGLSNNISDLTDADLTAVASQVSSLQTQLNASYSALSGLLKLNLATFLK